MPRTRQQEQTVLQFPVQKKTTRARTKSVVEISPRKRTAKADAVQQSVNTCSPPKRAKAAPTRGRRSIATSQPSRRPSKAKANNRENIAPVVESPVILNVPTPVRSPLREVGRALNFSPERNGPKTVPTPESNRCLTKARALTFSPVKTSAIHDSPIKQDLYPEPIVKLDDFYKSPKKNLFSSPLKVPQSPLTQSDKLMYYMSPTKTTPVLKTPKKSALNVSSPVRSSPRKLAGTATPSKTVSIFTSPLKNDHLSPRRHLMSPLKQACLSEAVRCSPRKLVSPMKLSSEPVRSSPRKHVPSTPVKNLTNTLCSPRKELPASPAKLIEAVRCSPRKHMSSALRLARQEGVCYQRAKQALHTAMPERIVCREQQMATIESFLRCHISKQPGSLYISGAPGTGKTAVLSTLRKDLNERKDCINIYVNCMAFRNSQAIFNKVLSEVEGKDRALSTKQASKALEVVLTKAGKSIVLILDEMDALDSKNQEVLYSMFEWPALPKSRVVLIGIANALDLTDRILPRLQARPKFKPQLLQFPPYTKDQIVKVLQDRLAKIEVEGEVVLEPTAIQFCARKVAAVAGDMRKALDVCRRAVEMVEVEVRKQQVLQATSVCMSPSKRPPTQKKINVAHISKIVGEVYGTRVNAGPGAGGSQTIPLQQKLAICSLLLLLKSGKGKEVLLGKLHEVYTKVCRNQQVAGTDQSEFLGMCSLIEARGIMTLKKAKDTRNTKVSLKLDEKELEHALQDRVLMSAVLKNGIPK